jgi:hypothetical protein
LIQPLSLRGTRSSAGGPPASRLLAGKCGSGDCHTLDLALTLGNRHDVDDSLRLLAADSGALLAARGQPAAAGSYLALELEFGSGTLRLSCDDDTDELLATVPGTRSDELADVTGDAAFVGLAGSVIEYGWTMTNHRGYTDAFQLRFIDPVTRAERTRQFEVAASTIWVQQFGTPRCCNEA